MAEEQWGARVGWWRLLGFAGLGRLRGRGEVQAGGDRLDRAVQAFEERLATSLAAVADPVAARETPGGCGELGQDVQPEVVGVQVEFAGEAWRSPAF